MLTNSHEEYCPTCNSTEVARCKWVNPNTYYIYSQDSGTTLEWCMICKEQTTIKTRIKKKVKK